MANNNAYSSRSIHGDATVYGDVPDITRMVIEDAMAQRAFQARNAPKAQQIKPLELKLGDPGNVYEGDRQALAKERQAIYENAAELSRAGLNLNSPNEMAQQTREMIMKYKTDVSKSQAFNKSVLDLDKFYRQGQKDGKFEPGFMEGTVNPALEGRGALDFGFQLPQVPTAIPKEEEWQFDFNQFSKPFLGKANIHETSIEDGMVTQGGRSFRGVRKQAESIFMGASQRERDAMVGQFGSEDRAVNAIGERLKLGVRTSYKKSLDEAKTGKSWGSDNNFSYSLSKSPKVVPLGLKEGGVGQNIASLGSIGVSQRKGSNAMKSYQIDVGRAGQSGARTYINGRPAEAGELNQSITDATISTIQLLPANAQGDLLTDEGGDNEQLIKDIQSKNITSDVQKIVPYVNITVKEEIIEPVMIEGEGGEMIADPDAKPIKKKVDKKILVPLETVRAQFPGLDDKLPDFYNVQDFAKEREMKIIDKQTGKVIYDPKKGSKVTFGF